MTFSELFAKRLCVSFVDRIAHHYSQGAMDQIKSALRKYSFAIIPSLSKHKECEGCHEVRAMDWFCWFTDEPVNYCGVCVHVLRGLEIGRRCSSHTTRARCTECNIVSTSMVGHKTRMFEYLICIECAVVKALTQHARLAPEVANARMKHCVLCDEIKPGSKFPKMRRLKINKAGVRYPNGVRCISCLAKLYREKSERAKAARAAKDEKSRLRPSPHLAEHDPQEPHSPLHRG